MAVEGEGRQQILRFRTLTDDWAQAGHEHLLRFAKGEGGTLRPYIHIRQKLEALVARAVYYDVVELGCEEMIEGVAQFGVWSAGQFFAMAPVAEIAAWI